MLYNILLYITLLFFLLFVNIAKADEYNVKIKDNLIYINNNVFYGFFVYWNLSDYDPNTIEEEVINIKKLGFKGITFDIHWDDSEKQIYNYTYDEKNKKIIELADKHGLFIQILLADHYMPSWVADAYKTRDENNNIYSAHYLPYSIYSPIAEHILHWQSMMIKHYSQYKNVISFLLSNESGFCWPNDDKCGDYSTYANEAWNNWQLKKFGYKKIDYMPKSQNDKNYLIWTEFRRETLQDYLHKKIINAKNTNKYKIYANKHMPYEWNSYNAYKINSYVNKEKFNDDFLAVNLYGLNNSTIGMINAFYNVPKWATETNLDFYQTRDNMKRYLIYQFKNGMFIQNLFHWDKGNGKVSYRDINGHYSDKLLGALDALNDINNNGMKYIKEYQNKVYKSKKISIAIPLYILDNYSNKKMYGCNKNIYCNASVQFLSDWFFNVNKDKFIMIYLTNEVYKYNKYIAYYKDKLVINTNKHK